MDLEAEIRALQLDSAAKEKAAQEKAAKEEEAEEEAEANKKRHLNAVFIGHVDAGKSTIGGQILFLSGQVDDRQIQKYEKEAKDKSRESWYMAYIMDTNEEERAKGKTVEVGRAHFETKNTRFTLLDAPGHKSYVPNMISGASQADIGVLVISARKGEFETGFEKGGQTREHVQLAKTLGVSKLVVVVNKMDDPTVNWSKERYDKIEQKMVPFLKSSRYNTKKDVIFLPISGLMGVNMDKRMDHNVCPWYSGPSFFEVLDSIEVPPRDNGPFRMPIIDKFKDMGTVVMGKVESGSIKEGDSLIIMPNKEPVKVVAIFCDEDKVKRAGPGENLRVRITGIEDEDILSGFVLSSTVKPVAAVTEFVAQLQIIGLPEKAVLTAGYKAILHIHAVVEECEIMELISEIDMETREPMKNKRVRFVKNGAGVVCRIQVTNSICVEKFSDFPQLGRFTLRTEGSLLGTTMMVSPASWVLSPSSSIFFNHRQRLLSVKSTVDGRNQTVPPGQSQTPNKVLSLCLFIVLLVNKVHSLLKLFVEVTESVSVLKTAAKTRKVAAEEILAAFAAIEKAKVDPSPFLETLGGSESPGRTWMLIFTAEKKLKKGRYFPLTAVQRFDAAGKRIENGVYLGPLGALTFEGKFSWKNRILAFIFEQIRIKIGPLDPIKIGLGKKDAEEEPSNKDPFFIWFYVDEEIAVARGRSGGTAFWCRCRRIAS
uniref:Eukaryotic peptide chain release factor GTP-binding subunit n=1 Tax=Brassica campestris TaxID=3711 RepID=M4DJ93_BRACM